MDDYKNFLKEIVKKCQSKADLCRALDKKPTGGNYRTIDNIIKKYNLDVSHFSNSPWNKGIRYKSPQYSLEELLIKDSPIHNTYKLKLRLVNAGIKEYKCEVCGYTDSVELHHINGDATDNRIENLQMLCPNCHSKTQNYRSKNIQRGRIHSTREELALSEEEIILRDKARLYSKRKKIGIDEAERILIESPDEFYKVNRRELKDIVCPICGKIFHPKYFEQKYCSEECMHKSQQKAERPTKEEFLKIVADFGVNFTQLGKHFGVTDNAIRKWCKFYGIPHLKKELQEYIKTK